MNAAYLIYLGLALIILGFLAVMFGALLSGGKADVRGGGVVFIGPVSLVFGTDNGSAVTVGALAAVLMRVMYFLFYRRLL